MKFSWGWLCDYLEPRHNALNDLPRVMLQAGIEVDNIVDKDSFNGFEVVEIVDIKPHPNATNLNLCFLKGKGMPVVCGAKNVFVGMKCIMANIGAFVPGLNQTMAARMIRGIESHGMLCSPGELGLDPSDGLLEVPDRTKVEDILLPNGPIFDVSITPNRGDLLSIYGIAREMAAFGLGSLKKPNISSLTLNFEESSDVIKVSNPTVLSMYSVRLNKIYNNTSPQWLQIRLREVGIKSHSAIVDVVNYVTHSLGQPLHAFDADNVGHIEIVGHSESSFIDLNGKEHKIDDLCCMVSNGRCIAIPGVIGGDLSKCSSATSNILLEGGNYDPDYIHNAQQIAGITNASRRFFHGIDANMTRIAILEAAAMIEKICQCSFGRATVSKSSSPTAATYRMPVNSLNPLGIKTEFASNALKMLGFSNVEGDDYAVPSWRHDIIATEDLLEEILRMFGYENIEEKPIYIRGQEHCTSNPEALLRQIMIYQGLTEVVNKDFLSKELYTLFGQDDDLILANPMSQSQFCVRSNIFANLIQLFDSYMRYNWQCRGIFEIGDVFSRHGQDRWIGFAFSSSESDDWLRRKGFSYFHAKQIVERCVRYIFGEDAKPHQAVGNNVLDDVCKWMHNGIEVAMFGRLSQSAVKSLKCKHMPFLGQVKLAKVPGVKKQSFISEQEVVTRDISMRLPAGLQASNVIDKLKSGIPSHIKVKLFDVYPDALLKGESRSIAVKLVWDELPATLTTEQINHAIQQAEEIVVSIGCRIRQS